MLNTGAGIDRDFAIAWYKKNRARTSQLFDVLTDEAYYAQPIALRHPIVFYEGHLPAFSLNTLVKKALGRPGFDQSLERLFARGIDPDESDATGRRFAWPDRARVRAFVDAADALVLDALASADLARPVIPCSTGPKPSIPSSSTRRCIRRRSSICGIVSRLIRSVPRRAARCTQPARRFRTRSL